MEQNTQKGLNLPLLLSAIIIILMLAGAGFYVFSQSRNNSSSNTSTQTSSDNSITPSPTLTTTSGGTIPVENTAPGQYVEYVPNLLSEYQDKKVVYFFKASWCPTCQALDRNLNNSLSSIPSNTVIVKVDYDSASGATSEELGLKPKYGVTYQHTLVQVDSSGNQIKKWNNSYTLDEILREIN